MSGLKKITITYLGVSYKVDEGLPIVKALESAGIPIRHGSGCRQGFCGACSVMYRMPNEARLNGALACETLVLDGMQISRVPYFPVHREDFDPKEKKSVRDFLGLYPELENCIECHACTEICPKDLQVEEAVLNLKKGEIGDAAEKMSGCISCGLCAVRCPAGIAPHVPSVQSLRVVGTFKKRPPSEVNRMQEVNDGVYERKLEKICELGLENIEKRIDELRAAAIKELT